MIITIITAFCTVSSLIVIYLTLREMKTQRFKVFEPYIFPVTTEFAIRDDDSSNVLHLEWLTGETNDSILSKVSPYFSLKNIGQGVAKEINIEIHFDIKFEKYFDLLKSDLKQHNSDININVSDTSSWVELRKQEEIVYACNFPYEFNKKYKFDYLLPIRDNIEYSKIDVPNCIQEMISLTLLLYNFDRQRFNNKNDVFKRLFSFFRVEINLDYKDNLNKQYSDRFKMTLEIPSIRFDSRNGGMLYTIKFMRQNMENL